MIKIPYEQKFAFCSNCKRENKIYWSVLFKPYCSYCFVALSIEKNLILISRPRTNHD